MTESQKNIPFIHSYCDRWCERCTFTERCDAFALEQQQTDAEKDINDEAFWQNLMNMFADAKDALTEKAEELGLDLSGIDDEDFIEKQSKADEIIRNEPLTKLAEKYSKESGEILHIADEWLIFSPLDTLENNEMLDVIIWFQHFILVKMQRGLSGVLDFDGKMDLEEINNIESDANGSVKVGLIAIDRSINAWTHLSSKENEPQIQPLLNLLQEIKQTAETKFPKARDFIRPGFDECEVVM